MSSNAPRGRPHAADTASERARSIENALARFIPSRRTTVRALAARHPALADLSLSFPALLFALAVPRDLGAAERGVAAVVAGASLREAASAAGAPMWLRGLPPEAFAKPLGELPDGPFFARRIANHPPRTPRRAAPWLEAVEMAARCGDERIAIWMAREFASAPRKTKPESLRLVCLWAWFSTRTHAASQLIEKRWSDAVSFKQAQVHAQDWLLSVEVACWLGDRGLDDGWLAPAEIGDLTLAPLLTSAELIANARATRTCVRTYARRLRTNARRLWEVRRGDERIATLELGALSGQRFVQIAQARGAENRPLPHDVESALHEWLRAQPLREAPTPSYLGRFDAAAWRALWRPYWLEKRALPDWLPLCADPDVLHRLRWGV